MLMDASGLVALAVVGVFYFSTQALLVWVIFHNMDSRQRRRLGAHIFRDDQIRGLGRDELREHGPSPASDRQNRTS